MITVACVLCMASTVLVKQHAFIDTVGALISSQSRPFSSSTEWRFLCRKNAAVPVLTGPFYASSSARRDICAEFTDIFLPFGAEI